MQLVGCRRSILLSLCRPITAYNPAYAMQTYSAQCHRSVHFNPCIAIDAMQHAKCCSPSHLNLYYPIRKKQIQRVQCKQQSAIDLCNSIDLCHAIEAMHFWKEESPESSFRCSCMFGCEFGEFGFGQYRRVCRQTNIVGGAR